MELLERVLSTTGGTVPAKTATTPVGAATTGIG